MQNAFAIPLYLDYFATFAWALSGAVVGARRGYDVVGVFVIALVSSTGGGLIRDGFLLHRTPALLADGVYLGLIIASTAMVGLAAKRLVPVVLQRVKLDKLVELIDAVGLPAFSIVGMQIAQAQGISIPGVMLVGVINGVGGGLMRDVLARETPRLLLPGQYSALVVLVACSAFLGLTKGLAIDATKAAFATIALFFIVRALTVQFNWTSNPLLRDSRE